MIEKFITITYECSSVGNLTPLSWIIGIVLVVLIFFIVYFKFRSVEM
jgi:hypothetical protein